MIRYVLVDGTHGEERPHDFSGPGSQFRQTLTRCGAVEAFPFEWTTGLDGLWGRNVQWEVGGVTLSAVPYLCPERAIASADLVVIAFSHGAQVAFHAFANGLCGRLITVNPPVRSDMRNIIGKARLNLRRWVNLYGDWKDIWAVLGAIGDGHLGLRRQFPSADANILVPGVHGAALRDSDYADAWSGWLDEVMQ